MIKIIAEISPSKSIRLLLPSPYYLKDRYQLTNINLLLFLPQYSDYQGNFDRK